MRAGITTVRAGAWVALLTSALALAALSGATAATRKVPVLTSKRLGEYQPARGGGYLAWEQNSRANPDRFDVYAKRDGGKRFRVNARGFQAAMGGIAGDLLVYQQFKGTRLRSNIKFYNLRTGRRRSPPVYVNTGKWEYWPSVSGDWILFGRRNASATRRSIILFNRATLVVRVIDRTTNRRSFISPGQVNGDWVVWHRCRPVPNCNVFRYNISTRLTRRIPSPKGWNQHAASVTADGTIYFARARTECGPRARLVRYPVGGPAKVLARMGKGRDAGDSFATTRGGSNHFYFERNRCGANALSDIYKLVD